MMVIAERAARAQYASALKVAADPEGRAVLERLRDEEEFHADYLQETCSRLAPLLEKAELPRKGAHPAPPSSRTKWGTLCS